MAIGNENLEEAAQLKDRIKAQNGSTIKADIEGDQIIVSTSK